MTRRMRHAALCLLLLAAALPIGGPLAPAPAAAQEPSAASAAPGPHFPDDEDLRVMLRYLVEDGETPGIVLGILEADGSTHILFHGDAGPEALPLGPRSAFELGSITKAFTGILLADMVERGEVALSDPVSRYMPEGVTIPSRNGREITLLDLATHRSSLPRMPDDMEREDGERYPEYTMADLHAFISRHELRRDIGSEYEYSNIAVALLGDALARAAGKSYEELLRERILDPLGMDMTSTVVDGEIRRWMTRGHDEGGEPAAYRNWPDLPAMGALRSNAEDMLTFLAANVGEPGSRLERVLRSAYEPRAEVAENVAIGLNWQIRTYGDRTIVTHSGGTAGYSTKIAFDPELGVGIVRLANRNGFGDDLGLDVLVRGRPLAIPEVEVPAEILATYVGQYGGAVVRLEPEGWLTVQTPDNVRFRMYAESDSSFFLKRTPWRFTFTKDETGAVAGLVADLEGRERRARRTGESGAPPAVVAGNAALDLPLTAEEMARYVGTYLVRVNDRDVELRVFLEDGRLMGQPGGDSPSRLMYQGEHQFVPEVALDFRLEFTLENGLAREVELDDDGDVYRGTRRHFPADEDLRVMLRYLVEEGATPGIVLGILEADGSTRVLYEGSAGPESPPLGPRSAFEIGSINKTFTGTLLADMVARGEVAFDDPVAKYLPKEVTVPSWEGREITLLDLATHHSGLPRLAGNHMPADMSNPYADYTVETLYEFLSSHELRREPGTEFEYSNLGMGLLGHALARAAGTTYRDLLRARILEPLGMQMTGYALEGELGEWMTVGHDEEGQPVSFWTGTEAIDGAGGLRSNVHDMLTYVEANIGPADTDLERAMRDAQRVRERVDEDRGIGLGWMVRDYEGRKLVVHGGGTGGFSTMIGFDPEKGVGFVRLANGGEFPDDIGLDFLRRGPPLNIEEVDVAGETLETYVGRYQAGPDAYVAVRLEEDGYLTIRVPGNVRFRMYPEADSSFFLKRTPWRIRFLRDDAGDVIGLALDVEGTERRARKVSGEPEAPGEGAEPGGTGAPDP